MRLISVVTFVSEDATDLYGGQVVQAAGVQMEIQIDISAPN